MRLSGGAVGAGPTAVAASVVGRLVAEVVVAGARAALLEVLPTLLVHQGCETAGGLDSVERLEVSRRRVQVQAPRVVTVFDQLGPRLVGTEQLVEERRGMAWLASIHDAPNLGSDPSSRFRIGDADVSHALHHVIRPDLHALPIPTGRVGELEGKAQALLEVGRDRCHVEKDGSVSTNSARGADGKEQGPVKFIDLTLDDPRWSEALPVLQELRPHLTAASLQQVLHEGEPQGLTFTALYDDDRCWAVAGWRVIANTSAIRKLYVDDLSTTAEARSRGFGTRLLAELARRGSEAGCRSMDLDSGVQRYAAHRFYLRERMNITAHHFTRPL